ncbi:MAG: choice-of-anchor B family protein [Bacteroidetes Order II. Incertae sedis bacterium]|jgi:choice-of-anchor B domain-containing protein|nr:choice-of-anchor B family protein [Bacteroidetes Order II. bacterium]MBT4053079.1 choice-of-anchor B family protein [Bacteroidetes Order II. bacterium]MBT5250013.1 choice-of-anchor B family protein [Bacteroidetes Order II. bacterium]MBT6200573.1 choice-of-anchor B family protein [Bacteroidetes Order II. bacterium]MBT6425056.1 choice-of-anchor B family protein [Bacteroidetes Order II. bacterium]
MPRFSAFIFVLLVAVSPVLAQTLYSDNASMRLGFGGVVSVYEGDVYIGSAPITWPAGADPAGQILRYSKNDEGQWIEIERIAAEGGVLGDEFGRSFNITDGQMVVGAPGQEAVYVFGLKDNKWTQTAKVSPHEDLPDGHEFAGSFARGGFRTQNIAVVQNNVMVTSYDQASHEGAVHVVHQMGTMWHDMGELEKTGAWAVASSGNHLFLGTAEADSAAGGVVAYEYVDSRNWVKREGITKNDLGAGARFGRAFATKGNMVWVGASGFERFGAVFAYEFGEDATWRLVDTIVQTGEDQRPSFGSSLSVNGDYLLIGASGAAYLYDINMTGDATLRLEAEEDRATPGFGTSVAMGDGFAIVGSPTGDFDAGLASVFEHTDAGWERTAYLFGDVNRMESITGTDKIDCTDGLANGLFPCEDVDLVSFLATDEMSHDRGAKLNDIWGWEDPQTGKEYVLQGRNDGLSVVDISNPASPLVVGNMMRTEGSPGAWWRDVKVYKNHAFVVADGSRDHGLQILDLTQVRDIAPADMPVMFEETAHYAGTASTHNVVINEDTGFAYLVGNRSGGETCGGQLHIVNIQDPQNPTFAGCYNHPDFGGTHDAQCVLYHGADEDYAGSEICLNSNGSAFIVADVTDKENTKTISTAFYPNTNYTHQGWLSEDHNYFYMNDELDEMNDVVAHTRTLIWDMSDLDEPILVKEFYLDSSASDHNLYIKGNLMYQSNYQAGLRILDITDPENPVEVGHFDTAPNADDVKGFGGSWSNYPYFKSGIIAVSSQGEGLYLLRKREVDL